VGWFEITVTSLSSPTHFKRWNGAQILRSFSTACWCRDDLSRDPTAIEAAVRRLTGKERTVARIYIASTYTDLKDYREAAYVALRRLGHQSVAMEGWEASDQAPLEKSLEAVRQSDVIVFLVAWRYGYVPFGEQRSITELELETARKAQIPCLIFLAPDEVSWPQEYIDKDVTNIRRFRERLLSEYLVGFFRSPDQLAHEVAVSLHHWVASGARDLSIAATPTEDTPRAEVFLSYAHEDIAVAQSLSKRISKERWSVFWDREIPVGLTWDDIVEAALDGARCVVVLWSAASRNSEWVRIEATEGAERRILAPALIEETKIPLRFRRIQAANLVGWGPGGPDTPEILALISAIARHVRREGRAASS
jgi:Domain of unknown function (DUF4062)/TIR domain